VTLLGLQEMDLRVHEGIWTEELERGLRHPDGDDCKKHMLIYIYIYIYILSRVENLCHYTLSPCPNHSKLGSLGLGWTCGTSLLWGIPEKLLWLGAPGGGS
jgi:hypothetical protein